jgi:hypothetical protein
MITVSSCLENPMPGAVPLNPPFCPLLRFRRGVSHAGMQTTNPAAAAAAAAVYVIYGKDVRRHGREHRPDHTACYQVTAVR